MAGENHAMLGDAVSNGRETYGCDFAMPLGATLSSSSRPNTLCRSPFGCGLGCPNISANSGADRTSRRGAES
jgi:hypothetical protein